jgi:phospholipid transport system substrate-binding protein
MSRTQRSLFLAASVLALSTGFFAFAPHDALAAQNVSAQQHDQAIQQPAGKFVQDLGDRAIKIIADKQMPADQRNAEFSKILGDSFDLHTIGRFVIGRSWNSATPAQQSEYMDLFKALVIKNYGSRMTLYTGEGFQVTSVRPESDMDTTVSSQITHPDGSDPTTIDWRVRNKDGKLGIIDVVVEGVSLSVTQRQEYSSIIQNNDGQIEPLLQMMRDELKASTAPAK